MQDDCSSHPIQCTLYYDDNIKVLEHLQAMGLQVQLIYLDPPYNTGRLRGARRYFQDRQRADWETRLRQLIQYCYDVLLAAGFLAASINQQELFRLKGLLDAVFSSRCFIGLFPVKIRHPKRQLMINATFHDLYEYLLIYRKKPQTRFHTIISPPRQDKFIYHIRPLTNQPQVRQLSGKYVEIYQPQQYEIIKSHYTPQALRRYIIAGKLATANWSGQWYEKNLRHLGPNLLIKVHGLEKAGLGYRWFQTGNARRRSGVYFQSQLNAGRPLLPANDLDYSALAPLVYREGGRGCDFKDAKKPEALLNFLLDICTRPGEVVLDPFAGSGTTLASAIKQGRHSIGIENDTNAMAIIRRRLENLKSGQDLDQRCYQFECRLHPVL